MPLFSSLDSNGKRALMRSDLNVPVKDGNEEPFGSSDFNRAPGSSIGEAAFTKVTVGNFSESVVLVQTNGAYQTVCSTLRLHYLTLSN